MQSALIEALPSLVQFLQQNPQVGVHHHDMYKAQVKLWLPVYLGSLRTISRAKRKETAARPMLLAKRVAWLCLLQTRRGVNAAVELKAEKSGSIRHQFQQGEIIQQVFNRKRAAARNPRLRRAVPAAKLLNVPPLYFSALWFKTGSKDLFVPLVRVGNIKAGGSYGSSEIALAL